VVCTCKSNLTVTQHMVQQYRRFALPLVAANNVKSLMWQNGLILIGLRGEVLGAHSRAGKCGGCVLLVHKFSTTPFVILEYLCHTSMLRLVQ